jgi:hypothetical protein
MVSRAIDDLPAGLLITGDLHNAAAAQNVA